MSFCHSPKRERANSASICTYVGLNIHATARDKKVIENFKQFGISITYDLVLQLESLLRRNYVKSVRKILYVLHKFGKGLLQFGS